jgi:ankyrin repeat protein
LTQICNQFLTSTDNLLAERIDLFSRVLTDFPNYRCTETQKTILSMTMERPVTTSNRQLIIQLLQQGANPCMKDGDGTSAWIKSIQINLKDQLIVDRSVRCHDVPDRDGRTAIWWAIARWSSFTLSPAYEQIFVGLKNMADLRGMTPLMLAAYLGKKDIAMWLLKHGAEKYASDVMGRNAMHYALTITEEKTTEDARGVRVLLRGYGVSLSSLADARREEIIRAWPHIPNMMPSWMRMNE